jgi:hypothetical protein
MSVALAGMTTAKASAQTPGRIRVTSENVRASAYLHELADPHGLIGVGGGAVLGRLRHEDRTELGDELAYRATQRVVGVSVRHGLAAAMHLGTDDQYQPCECRGFAPRVGHALVETFTDGRADGGRAFAAPRVAASFAEGITGLAWKHDRNVGDVVTGTVLSFGLKALFNIGRELTGINIPVHP